MEFTKAAHGPATRGPGALRVLLALARRCWPLLLGNVLEWYEFSAYGYVEPQIQHNFFPGSAWGTWLGFALTFVARPLGGVCLGWLSDRCGRRLVMNLSCAGMLLATVCQGLLPTFSFGEGWGVVGVVLLCALRCVQGLSAGGEIITMSAYLTESSPLGSLGLCTTLIPLTGGVAFFAAGIVATALTNALSEEQMMDWGWRVPFLLSLPPGLLAAWGRSRYPESEMFLQERLEQRRALAGPEDAGSPEISPCAEDDPKPQRSPTGQSLFGRLRGYWPSLLIGLAMPGTSGGFRYVATLWVLSYLKAHGHSAATALWVGNVANLVSLLAMPLVGLVADVMGSAFVCFATGAAAFLTGLPCFYLLVAFPGEAWAAYLGVGVVNALVMAGAGCTFVLCAELFPTSVRSLGLGLSYNLGTTFFGGFGGLLAEASLAFSPMGPGLLMSSFGLAPALAMLWALQLRRQGYVVAHRRAEPFFGRAPGGCVAAFPDREPQEPWGFPCATAQGPCNQTRVLPVLLGQSRCGPPAGAQGGKDIISLQDIGRDAEVGAVTV